MKVFIPPALLCPDTLAIYGLCPKTGFLTSESAREGDQNNDFTGGVIFLYYLHHFIQRHMAIHFYAAVGGG